MDEQVKQCCDEHATCIEERCAWRTRYLVAEVERLRKDGFIIAARVLQSNLRLDDTEIAARDAFLRPDVIKAALAAGREE